ncbi:Atu4866 domain-containing protein [Isoptericola halotolerans]|uniref:Atu4866 domain-containing protein n=1 Tax=Isoptericola halotolerans TaxID=300560 RepID=UPI00388F773C
MTLNPSKTRLPAPPTSRTVVVAGARVWQTSRAPVVGDLSVAGDRLAPGPAAPDAEVVRAGGADAVPLFVDSAVAQLPPARRGDDDLRPGNAATFAVVRRPVRPAEIRRMLIVDPSDLLGVWVAGEIEVWDGRPTRPAGRDVGDPTARETWVATWDDPRRDMQQHLGPDGRYSETRGGRADAYTGRYWVRGDRITYLDDSGFWAFGQLLDGVLHHAGYVMTRR